MPERQPGTLERLSALYAGDREQAEKDQQEGQARAAQWMTSRMRLHPKHPDYAAWRNAVVNGLEWPPQEEVQK